MSTDVVAPWWPVLGPMWSYQVHGSPNPSSSSTYCLNCGSLSRPKAAQEDSRAVVAPKVATLSRIVLPVSSWCGRCPG